MARWWRSFAILILGLALGCSRPMAGDSAITIRVPEGGRFRKALPAGRTGCYGINVTGRAIPSNSANACSPSTGIVAGYVGSGQDVSVNVPKGLTVDIDLYLYLQPLGATAACPGMSAAIPANQLANTFRVGSAKGIALDANIVTVDITAVFPGTDQNIAQQLALPANCLSLSSPLPASPFTISTGQQVMTGSGLKLSGRIGDVNKQKILTGSGYKLIVR